MSEPLTAERFEEIKRLAEFEYSIEATPVTTAIFQLVAEVERLTAQLEAANAAVGDGVREIARLRGALTKCGRLAALFLSSGISGSEAWNTVMDIRDTAFAGLEEEATK
jgi:hypothetical protein